jgi:hypothetical protein
VSDNDLTSESLLKDFLGGDFDFEDTSSFKTNDEDVPGGAGDDEFDQLLRDFIFSENHTDEEDSVDITNMSAVVAAAKKEEELKSQSDEEFIDNLREQERNLFDAYLNFKSAIKAMAQEHNIKLPKFALNAKVLYPKYKPRMAQEIAADTLMGWDVMLQAHPTRISSIDPTATDEQLLDFAEKTTDDNLQLAMISYVEILIEIEGCEIDYEKRRLRAKKKKIEKEIMEEHQKRAERAQKYIVKIREKKFPIDAERLVKNFFKTSKKDAENAYKALTTNPATFAPIDFGKIKPRFFGFIKVTPQDGIRINKKLGEFLKKLRV